MRLDQTEVVHLASQRRVPRIDGGLGDGQVVALKAGILERPGEVIKLREVGFPRPADEPIFMNVPRENRALADLLDGIIVWLKERDDAGLVEWPPEAVPPRLPSFPVAEQIDLLADSLQLMDEFEMTDEPTPSQLRVLEAADLKILRPIMEQLGLELEASQLPLVFQRWPLRDLLTRFFSQADTPALERADGTTASKAAGWQRFLEEESKPRSWAKEGFSYDLRRHKNFAQHPLVLSVVERLETDMKEFKQQQERSLRVRMRHIGGAFEGAMRNVAQVAEIADGMRRKAIVDRARVELAQAAETLKLLQTTLRKGHADWSTKLSNAIHLLLQVANHVSKDESSGSIADNAVTDADEKARRRFRFLLLRATKQKRSIDFLFMAKSLLSATDAADWLQLNPFLQEEVQRELMKLLALTLLHCSTMSHLHVQMLESRRLANLIRDQQLLLDECAALHTEPWAAAADVSKCSATGAVVGVVSLGDMEEHHAAELAAACENGGVSDTQPLGLGEDVENALHSLLEEKLTRHAWSELTIGKIIECLNSDDDSDMQDRPRPASDQQTTSAGTETGAGAGTGVGTGTDTSACASEPDTLPSDSNALFPTSPEGNPHPCAAELLRKVGEWVQAKRIKVMLEVSVRASGIVSLADRVATALNCERHSVNADTLEYATRTFLPRTIATYRPLTPFTTTAWTQIRSTRGALRVCTLDHAAQVADQGRQRLRTRATGRQPAPDRDHSGC